MGGQFQDIQDRERFAAEQKAVQEVNFSKHEVSEFRKLFMSVDTDGDGLISRLQAMQMMETICPLGAKNTAEFTSIFRQIVERRSGYEGEDLANFADFLYLVKRLVDVDFAQINERSKAWQVVEDNGVHSFPLDHQERL